MLIIAGYADIVIMNGNICMCKSKKCGVNVIKSGVNVVFCNKEIIFL